MVGRLNLLVLTEAIRRCLSLVIWSVALIFSITENHAASRWGADYFPNVPLVTHEGKTVRFFEDLIENKVVVINFIYTSCPDTCPLETAQLTRVQSILGDRMGRDVFFYSITIDPDNDTVETLRSYREKFGAKWTFLTGDEQDIISLRRKLGLFIEDLEGGPRNHNVSMIIGNQSTGRWMKRSPYENPHVLADQIGNWLSGWKAPQKLKDFANAPALRTISDGEKLYRTRCIGCHTIDGSRDSMIGPDLLGVTKIRNRAWLINWLRAPDRMLAEQDPIAMKLFKQFNEVAMPNMRLTPMDIQNLLEFMHNETDKTKVHAHKASDNPKSGHSKSLHTATDLAHARNSESESDVVAVMNAWIREAVPQMAVNAGYMTLVNVGSEDAILIGVESELFGSVGLHEMASVDGLMKMQALDNVVVPARSQVQFSPGGMHLMLKDPTQDMRLGQVVDLVLRFESGSTQTVSVKVAKK